MPKGVIWSLVIIGAVVVLRLLTSDTQTNLTPPQQREQMAPLWHLFVFAFFASPVVAFLVVGVKRYKQSGNWVFLFPFIGIVVLYGGLWAWVGYFADHGAFLLWPLIVVVVLVALLIPTVNLMGKLQQERISGILGSGHKEINHGPTKLSDLDEYIDDEKPAVKFYDPPADILKKYGLDKLQKHSSGNTAEPPAKVGHGAASPSDLDEYSDDDDDDDDLEPPTEFDHGPAHPRENTYRIDDYRQPKPQRRDED